MNTKKQINNYIVRQRNWIKANNIQEGTELIVFKSIKGETPGWEAGWVEAYMKCPNLIKTSFHETDLPDAHGIETLDPVTGYWYYPYNCLKVAIDPAKTYISHDELIKMRYYVETTAGHKFIGKIEYTDLSPYYGLFPNKNKNVWKGFNIMGMIFYWPDLLPGVHEIKWELVGMQNQVKKGKTEFYDYTVDSFEKELEKAEIKTLRVFY